MSFNSVTFAIFLPIVFFLYWAIPKKYQWVVLLISSYYFYMNWNIKYIFLILFTTAISYLCGRLLSDARFVNRRKIILFCSISVCLFVLFLFKYFNFFTRSFCNFTKLFSLQLHSVTLNLLLPVGISFYIFQTLSYVIDVYHGKVQAEKHFGKYAVFISFFPQLVAGPIERTDSLLPQIKEEHYFRCEDAVYGLRQMLWGFFKKIVIADTLSYYVDLVYDEPLSYRGGYYCLQQYSFPSRYIVTFPGILISRSERRVCLEFG